MITLHRLGHGEEPFDLNPDLIMTVEANPDTVISLTTGAKIVVAESRAQVADAARAYRIEIASGAMRRRHDEPGGARRDIRAVPLRPDPREETPK